MTKLVFEGCAGKFSLARRRLSDSPEHYYSRTTDQPEVSTRRIVIGNDAVADKFGGLLGYPFLISEDGKIVKKARGLIGHEEITKAIEAQL